MNEKSQPVVSVCMITYNHEPYIAEAIEGVLMQKTTLPIELVIGEDCSSDNTKEIIERYQKKYPDIIKLLPSIKNLGMSQNFLRVLEYCGGEFIAFCEGDDYWTDPNKLQKQVNYLENTPKANGCFHNVPNVDKDSTVIKENYYKPQMQVYTQKDCLIDLGSAYATCSLVCRSVVFKEPLPIWFEKRACDEFLDLLITENGGELHHLKDQRMAAYRIHEGGIWQGSDTIWRKKEVLLRKKLLKLDKKFYKKYKTFLDTHIEKHYQSLFMENDLPFIQSIPYGIGYVMTGGMSLRKSYYFIRGIGGRIKRALIK